MRLEKRMLFGKRALLKIACTEADTLLRIKDEIIAAASDSGIDSGFALSYFLEQMSFFEVTDLETEEESEEEESDEEEEDESEEEDDTIPELEKKEFNIPGFPRNPPKIMSK